MIKQYFGYVVSELAVIWLRIADLLPSLLAALVIVGITVVLAKLIKNIVEKMLRVVGVNVLSKRVGIDDFIKPGALASGLSELIGILVYWLLLFIGVTYALGVVGFATAEALLGNLMLYLPKVFVAIILLVIGVHVAIFLGNVAEKAGVGARVKYARWLGNTVKGIVLLITAISIVEELAVNVDVLKVFLYITLGGAATLVTLVVGISGLQIGKEVLASFVIKSTVTPGSRIEWNNATVEIVAISACFTSVREGARVIHIPNSVLMRNITVIDQAAGAPPGA